MELQRMFNDGGSMDKGSKILKANETVFIVPVGYTPSYKEVKYILGDKEGELDWLSAIQLIKFLFSGTEIGNLSVVLLYPDNKDAEKSLREGWDPKVDSKIKSPRSSIISRFQGIGVSKIMEISIPDRLEFSEDELWETLEKLYKQIKILIRSGRRRIIFDLTHSYRHISFAGFIESLFLSNVFKEIEQIEVYYAVARQPLKNKDPVYYIKLDSFIDLIRTTERIRDIIAKLRAEDLYEMLNEIRTRLTLDHRNWLEKVIAVLFKLQIGVLSDETLEDLESLSTESIYETTNSRFTDWVIITEAIRAELSLLLKNLKSDTDMATARDYYHRQFFLARYSLERHGNIMLTYLYIREALISWFTEFLAEVEGKELTIAGGNKEERSRAEEFLREFAVTSVKEKPKNNKNLVTEFANFVINNIGGKRNHYAHVMAGRTDNLPKRKVYRRRLQDTENDLKKSISWVEEIEKNPTKRRTFIEILKRNL